VTGLEAAEERERDLSRRRRQLERETAALAVANKVAEEKEKECGNIEGKKVIIHSNTEE
jgi:hypothetical protein